MGVKRLAATLACLAVAVAVAARAYDAYPPLGWAVLSFTVAALGYLSLVELAGRTALRGSIGERRRRGRKSRLRTLEELVARLPETGEAVAFRLRELLVARVAARFSLPYAEAEATARRLVSGKLADLLEGRLVPESVEEVEEIIDLIDRL